MMGNGDSHEWCRLHGIEASNPYSNVKRRNDSVDLPDQIILHKSNGGGIQLGLPVHREPIHVGRLSQNHTIITASGFLFPLVGA